MAKLLIASIGTGSKNDNGKYPKYPYRDALYYPAENPNVEVCNTPLVAAALMKLYAIDELVLIGTAGSSWVSLYEYLFDENNTYIPAKCDKNDDYNYELLELFENSKDSKTLPSVRETKSKLKQLKDTIGESCRDIVVLEYGTNPDQQIENMAILNRFADSLRDGDEIYFDISHAFRSLPFYELLTVHLAQSILKRKVHIEMVSYAMLEASSIFAGKTPIVDMTQLIELLDWTRAVDEFNSKGTTFQLQSLLSGNNKIGARLKTLLHMNVWNAFNKLTETLLKETYDYNLQSMVGDVAAALKNSNSNLDDPVLLIINNVMTEVANYFSPYKESPAALCVAFALWKIEKKQPTLGVLLLMDAMENVLLELLGKNIHSDKEHDSIHERLLIKPISDNNEYARTFYNYYKEVRRLRNNVAHVNLKQLKDSHYKAKQIAKWYLNSYKNHFSTGKNDREVFRLSLLQ